MCYVCVYVYILDSNIAGEIMKCNHNLYACARVHVRYVHMYVCGCGCLQNKLQHTHAHMRSKCALRSAKYADKDFLDSECACSLFAPACLLVNYFIPKHTYIRAYIHKYAHTHRILMLLLPFGLLLHAY